MLLGGYVAKHRSPMPTDHGRPDSGSDVIVARRDIGYKRPQRIEGRLMADLSLLCDLHLDLIHRYVAGTFDHHLNVILPSLASQFSKRLELGKLCSIACVGHATGTETVSE